MSQTFYHHTHPACFLKFKENTEGYALPEFFTFPFNYEPNPLSILAANALQDYLSKGQFSFGLPNDTVREDSYGEGIGKMFGVLVVQNSLGELGYLAAFSGKLADSNHHIGFVPPVFDILDKNGFFIKEELEINAINRRIEALYIEPAYINFKEKIKEAKAQSLIEVEALKQDSKQAKSKRDARRNEAKTLLSDSELLVFEEKLNKESSDFAYRIKDLNRYWKRHFEALDAELNVFEEQIKRLKDTRKKMSSQLQQRLFEQYSFLNIAGESKSVGEIFNPEPPAGAGECAAPKLLQYAFLHNLKPICMAEFWWGKSPVSEIRKHGQFYPACKSKCEPILKHMLKGIALEENTLLLNLATEKKLDIVFEDDYILVVNKPAEMLSVPGKSLEESVYTQIKNQYPKATGPLIVHRLDMSTSGLLLIAKTKQVHQHLQNQFLSRKVKKRYVAVLEGIVEQNEGFIDLPLRVDLEDRPRQLVCYEHGKPAQTAWKIVEIKDKKTRIHFFPITGRTHQLRVHAAHPSGLNMPIVGDELYGNRADRLHLHAEQLAFIHPITSAEICLEVAANF